MDHKDFLPYNEVPCRFRLKNGKEIYGVVWENECAGTPEYYFSSLGEHKKGTHKFGQHIELTEIIRAEKLSEESIAV